MIQSGLDLARALETFVLGNICQMPKLGPLFSEKAVNSLLDFCIAVVAIFAEFLKSLLDLEQLKLIVLRGDRAQKVN